LSKLEKGASYPGLEIIAKLATVLGVEPAELLRVAPGKPERYTLPLTMELAILPECAPGARAASGQPTALG
jgi:transcriptional regulator with XRE-family HTH domain